MTNINVESVTGKEPNQAFTRGGFALLILSAVTYLGLSGFGVELGDHSELSPLVTMALAVYLMTYGGHLKKIQSIEKQKHELRLAEASTNYCHELKYGDNKYLEQIKKLPMPMGERDLISREFSYDLEKDEEQLRRALKTKRLMLLECAGYLTLKDGEFDLKDKPDMTVIK